MLGCNQLILFLGGGEMM